MAADDVHTSRSVLDERVHDSSQVHEDVDPGDTSVVDDLHSHE